MTPAAELEALYTAKHARYVSFAKVKTGDEAEDLVQDAYVSALSALLRGHGYTDHAGGWMWRIVRNKVVDHFRYGNRLETVDMDVLIDNEGDKNRRTRLDLLADDQSQPQEVVDRQLDLEVIRRLIHRLPANQEQVILMRLEGYEFDEIAEAIGKSRDAAKALQHRALVALRAMLAQWFEKEAA